MTTPDTPPPRRRRLLVVALLFAVVATLWWVSELYTTDAARACQEMYAGAKNAIDTNRIDLIAPASERRRAEPRTCATFRSRTPQ
ncbi:MAG TPA: hypothetical protein VL295_07520 [Gemmatimonadales bacterium]|jgi:hypothetical protein|nr:hypothetical protein [Gemmatimonadales bacterium]